MSEVKRYDISAFGGMSMDECTDGAYVMHRDYEALQAKCAALAAENSALKQSEKEFNNFCRQEYYGWEDNFTETPATDAFLAEVRAQGVEMFGQHHNFSEKLFIQKEAQKFAAHLRKGVDKNDNHKTTSRRNHIPH